MLKKLSDIQLQNIEYAIASVAMETNPSIDMINQVRTNLIKVSLGEITSQEYRNSVYKKYNLKSNENINININTIKPHKNTQNHTYISQK